MQKPRISLKQLKKDFSFLKQELKKKSIIAVLLYGSYAENKQSVRSDIDICIVAPKCRTIGQQTNMLRFLWRNVNTDKYDVRLFEEFPLKIKASVMENYKIIYANLPELQEYFYFCRKLWQDQSVNWLEKKQLV